VAGGVDAFLIGTEMPGLTTIRSGASTYPAVTAYKTLAADVSTMLGAGTKIGYAADWSEYFGHHPQDGSNDGLGDFTYVNRLSLVTPQATGMGFFGLDGSTAALATSLTLSAVANSIGIRWPLAQSDTSGAPMLTDLGASFPIASTTNVLIGRTTELQAAGQRDDSPQPSLFSQLPRPRPLYCAVTSGISPRGRNDNSTAVRQTHRT
jgi:hypothetical protein